MKSRKVSDWEWIPSGTPPSPSYESKYFRTVWLRLLMKERESTFAHLVDLDNSISRLEESFITGRKDEEAPLERPFQRVP